jgi:5-methylcytosine-specific restriction endonuclease McrA
MQIIETDLGAALEYTHRRWIIERTPQTESAFNRVLAAVFAKAKETSKAAEQETIVLAPYDHCYYCRAPLDGNNPQTGRKTLDHKQPKSRGGTDDPANVVPCCYLCNHTKGHMNEIEFKTWISIGRPNKREYLKALGQLLPARS